MKIKLKWVLIAALISLIIAASATYYIFKRAAYKGSASVVLYLRPNDNAVEQLKKAGVNTTGFHALSKALGYKMRPGRYMINPDEDIITIFRRLRNGQQEAVKLVLPSVRTMPDMASFLASNLMMDSAQVAQSLSDTTFTQRYGYSPETVASLFIPNTYEVYWNVSFEEFMKRMQREHDKFWNRERMALCDSLGLTAVQVATLASIVDEETANNEEKPMVAGMYLNRLTLQMPLQADPTVKFAVGDFALRRILKVHLEVDSPYNTYKYEGLPPGPIRVASVAGIDAVLHHVKHDFLFMCAKEDFSGTHNFAASYREHLQNARRYQRALDARNIK